MIGNLITALVFGLLSASVVIAGETRAGEVQNSFSEYNSVSHITGDDVVNYMSFERDFTSNSIPTTATEVLVLKYDDHGNMLASSISSSSLATTADVLTIANTLDDDYVYLLISKNNFVVNSRILVPSSYSQIVNIEFSLTGSFNYGQFGGMTLYRNNLNNYSKYGLTLDNGNLVWYGFSCNQNQCNGLAFDVGYDGFNFYDFGFSFTTSNENQRIHFDFLGNYSNSVAYAIAYNQGYSAGYTAGSNDGWGKGYADAMALVNGQGNFNSLFNSIADTPLRFIYGLFSFDLFGTSVLVIVLTLLTGIAVFGIVKKVWK